MAYTQTWHKTLSGERFNKTNMESLQRIVDLGENVKVTVHHDGFVTVKGVGRYNEVAHQVLEHEGYSCWEDYDDEFGSSMVW